jgi:hypothetical protein
MLDISCLEIHQRFCCGQRTFPSDSKMNFVVNVSKKHAKLIITQTHRFIVFIQQIFLTSEWLSLSLCTTSTTIVTLGHFEMKIFP